MILLINTSDKICKIIFVDGQKIHDYIWRSDMKLAKWLLGYLNRLLEKHSKTWSDIEAIGVYEGPGSFTGIRIGLTIMNTIADSQQIPIVGGRGDDWKNVVLEKIREGKNEKIVMPFYDREANITISKK